MISILGALMLIAQAQAGTIAWKKLPPPREVTEYSLYTEEAKGYMRLVSDTATYKGKPAIRVVLIIGLSNIEKNFIMRDSTFLYLDRETWKPFYSTRFVRRPGYKLAYEATYDSVVSIKLLRGNERKETTLEVVPEMYDNQELFLVFRRFPFEKGNTGEIVDVIPSALTHVRIQIEAVGDAKVVDAEGDSVEVAHLRLTMLSRHPDVYLEKKPPYRVVRYEDPSTGILMVLRKRPTGLVPKD